MTALQGTHPDLTVFLTFGHSRPSVLSDGGHSPLAETHYDLLAPFLDGFCRSRAVARRSLGDTDCHMASTILSVRRGPAPRA